MGLKKYPAEDSEFAQPNGSVAWSYTNGNDEWDLSLIRNCPTPMGKRTVYIQGPHMANGIYPAACYWRNPTSMRKKENAYGYVTLTEDGWEFHIVNDFGVIFLPRE